MKEKIKEILPYIIIFVAVILIRTFIATPVIVNGPSMQETLHTNDKLIKRVMAIPGDKIKCVSGIIYVNNEEVSNYGYGTSFDFPQIILGDDEYFLIGDNREDSLDSRYFGPVKKSDITGIANFRIFPFNKIGKLS